MDIIEKQKKKEKEKESSKQEVIPKQYINLNSNPLFSFS